MGELFDVLDALSLPLKTAWMIWLGWGAGQMLWYRRERVEVLRTMPPARPRPRRPPQTVAHPLGITPAGAPESPTLEAAEAS
jgi:hypothetical protein